MNCVVIMMMIFKMFSLNSIIRYKREIYIDGLAH